MSKIDKLLEQARHSPKNFRCDDLRRLARHYGFEFSRQRGSHEVWKHSLLRDFLNIQDDNGKAKDYQVDLLLKVIEQLEDMGYGSTEDADA